MVQDQANGRKRPSSEQKRISQELPAVSCERLNTNMLIFEWDVKAVIGKPVSVQSEALQKKLAEFSGDERKRAAVCLLEVPGSDDFKVASLIAVKCCGVDLGTVFNKVLNNRKPEESFMILEKAGITIDDTTREIFLESCENKTLDVRLHSIFI